MRAPVLVGMSAVSGVVLVVAAHAGQTVPGIRSGLAVAPAGVVAPGVAPASGVAPKPAAATTPRVTATPPAPSAKPAATSAAVNGTPVDTRYGPVQVQITVRSKRIIKADAIVYPQDSGRDREINRYAVPQLDDETVKVQTAQIDTVSGATFTSDGYRESLQSALDAAHQAGLI